jgi:hypothetical protein
MQVQSTPADASAAKITEYFQDHTGAIEAAQIFLGVGMIGLVWWFGSLWRMMVRAEDGRPRMAIVALLGLAATAGLALLSGALTSATALRIDDVGGGSRFFYLLAGVIIATAGFGVVAFLGAVCALKYRTNFMPQWITYLPDWSLILRRGVGRRSQASHERLMPLWGRLGRRLESEGGDVSLRLVAFI